MLTLGDRFTCRAFRRLVYGVRSDGEKGFADMGRLEFGPERVDMRKSGEDTWSECLIYAEDQEELARAVFRVVYVRPHALGHGGIVFAVEEGPRRRMVQFDTENLYEDSIEVVA